ncbi:hypothetical protein TRIUR3_16916 [Triticum urartu]|uniref:Carbohydrate kinase PfkB domain-containing protein n=1 Tax=Triticum urartu TaxID=4572 RepID=M7YXQ6_TRIUA|nr:hypothetical protein TRIUR3_16916 [Triticum urartu]
MLLTADELKVDVIKRVSFSFRVIRVRMGAESSVESRHSLANKAPLVLVLGGSCCAFWLAAVFHYGSISLIAEPCRTAHLHAMKVAKEAGALLSYDPNLREALWPSLEEARTKILSIWDQADIVKSEFVIWDQADIVKVSEVELEFLTGINSVEDDVAMKLWRPTFKLMLITLGDQGCKYYTKDFRGAVPSYKVQQVDTTGAGDAFIGSLLRKIVQDPSALQDKTKLEGAIKFANACGAITATKKGAIPSLPKEDEDDHSETVGGGNSLVNWKVVCQPKALGGLGIAKPERYKKALRLRLALADPGQSWDGFPLPCDAMGLASFRVSTTIVVGDGKKVVFWRDNRADVRALHLHYPELFTTASWKNRTVHNMILNDDMIQSAA